MKYCFGDIVVVRGEDIGVVVKSWICILKGKQNDRELYNYEVYVRNDNRIEKFGESQIQRYMVRHKFLSEEEKEYQYNAINGK